MSVKVLLVDDHPVFMAGIRAILENEGGISIEGEAKDGIEAVKMVKEKCPDVVVMDITMPNLNGIEATKQILDLSMDTKILALSIHAGRRFVKNMLDAGAAGYLLKDSAPEELLSAIQKVAKGEMYLSSTITSIALSKDVFQQDRYKVLTTKFHRPSITDEYLYRSKILEQLEKNVNKPLSLVSAPAGYGKSITISQWLDSTDRLNNWITLDEEHNNLRIFLDYLNAAIDQLFPGSLEKFDSLLMGKTLPSIQVLVHNLINELDKIQRKFILVLDDYHNITIPEIHIFIKELLRFSPKNLHLCILTRHDPQLSLSSLRVHNRMHEIRMKELSFSKKEINKFFKNLFKIELDKETTESLYMKTEGWIVGLKMISLTIDEEKNAKRILSKLDRNIHLVSEFLNTEILANESGNFRNQLILSSILDRFCVQVLEELFALEKSEDENTLSGHDFIEKLVDSNLFVIPLDNSRNWFRFHMQFRELLMDQLEKTKTQNEINAFHISASEWFEKNNLLDEAIEHASISGNIEKVSQIIELHGRKMINLGKWHVLNKWLSKLPDNVIQNRPELLIAKAWVHMFNFDVEALRPIMDRIDELMSQGAELHSFSGEVAYFRGHSSILEFQDGERSLEYLERALKLIPLDEVAFRAETELLFGIAGQMQGQSERVIKQVLQWLNDSKPLAPLREARLLLVLKLINYIELRPDEAVKYFDRCHSVAISNDLEESLCWCHYIEGLIFIQKCDFKSAIEMLEKVKKKRFLFHARAAVDAMIALTIAYELDGQTRRANNTILVLEEFNQGLGSYFTDFVNSCKTRLGILQAKGEPFTGLSRSSSCNPIRATLFWFEITCLTRCRLLISKGSNKDILEAEELLDNFENKNVAHLNYLHLIDILALKAILYYKQEKFKEAIITLERSLVLAESSEFILPFLESGAIMISLINLLPNKIKRKSNIENILNRIKEVRVTTNHQLKEGESVEKLNYNLKSFTPRELAVLQYLSRGMRNKEIATALFVSDDTIKKHLYNMFQKLSVKNRLSLVSKARELGFI